MILDATPSSLIPCRGFVSRGNSELALFVAERSERGREQLQDSFAFGLRGKGAFEELNQVFDECRNANWDGYGAAAVCADTYQLAYQFLEALPLGTPAPSLGAEPDGHLTLDWYRSPRRTLSVSVSPEGEVHYAALLGDGRAYGTEPFFGEVPATIVALIHRVMAP